MTPERLLTGGCSCASPRGDSHEQHAERHYRSAAAETTRAHCTESTADHARPARAARCAHVLAILGISHATLYAGLKTGRYPKPDGKDGKFPWWRTSTIRAFLDA